MSRILVAMSGGVDSSVAAALLARDGHEVVGVTMKLLDKSEADGASCASCCGYDASRDARLVAEAIGIPHYTVNAVEVFRQTVISDFVREYRAGRTPNPCVRCNQFVKFGFLMNRADELGCEFVATGHYALRRGNRLYRGIDPGKDQAYFLYVIYGAAIERIVFPVGGRTKSEIRGIAAELRLVTAHKPESQDICFVEDGNYSAIFENTALSGEGTMVDTRGKEVGRHAGIHKYTVGQRKGLGALGKKMFVKEIRPLENVVVVGTEDDLWAETMIVNHAVVAHDYRIDGSIDYDVQVRYRSKPVKARISQSDSKTFHIKLLEPVRAIAPGQSAVIYDGTMVVGGGVIERAG